MAAPRHRGPEQGHEPREPTASEHRRAAREPVADEAYGRRPEARSERGGEPMSRVVVIGAGVGGLAAAARLAAAGHTVTVCERAGTVGGKLGLLVRQTAAGVFRFDTGPSLLTMPHVFAELFA